MVPGSLEKLVLPTEKARDAYEESAESTSRPMFRMTVGLAIMSAYSFLKDLFYPRAVAAPIQPEDGAEEVIEEHAETAQAPAKDGNIDAAEVAEAPVEEEEEAIGTAGPYIEITPGKSGGRIVYFATPDSLEAGKIGTAPAGAIFKGRFAGNDNGDLPNGLLARANVSDAGGFGGGGGGGSGGGSGGGAGGAPIDEDTGPDVGDPVDTDDDDSDGSGPDTAGPRTNRAPVVNGSLALRDIFINQVIVIGLVDLLSRASDADGDTLSVRDVQVSEGSVTRIDDRTWLYTPLKDDTGLVEFTYKVSDGKETVTAKASVNINELPGSTLIGTDGDDALVGTPGGDFMYGLGGDDDIVGREWTDLLDGGSGNDRLLGGDGDDVLEGGDGDDHLFGGAGHDILHGGAGDDVMFGDAGNDILNGGSGDDLLDGGTGQDVLRGEAGHDSLAGGDDADYLDGGDGHDRLAGDGGNDVLGGGGGTDTVSGGDGDDVVLASENDGDDVLEGGDGKDTLDFSQSSAPVTVDLAEGTAEGAATGSDVVSGFENVVGTIEADTLVGDEAANVLTGGGGADTVSGASGDDVVVATVGDGDDELSGGEGMDTLDFSALSKAITVDLTSGSAAGEESGSDRISGFENVVGGAGDDTFVADDQVNTFTGGEGADVFVFRTTLSTGSGSGSRDRIQDLEVGDRIDIDDISREFERTFGGVLDDQDIKKFVLIQDAQTFSRPGELRVKYEDMADGRVTVLEGNIDSNPDTDFEIEIVGARILDDSYFMHNS